MTTRNDLSKSTKTGQPAQRAADGHSPGAGTLGVWGGEPRKNGAATQVPVVKSVSFGYEDLDRWLDVARGREKGHLYSRNTNPTVAVFEEKVRLLENAEAAMAAATGMAAISSTLFALLKPGDRVVSVKDSYGGTNILFCHDLPRFHIEVSLCETTDHGQLESEIAKGCTLLYLETPTNPTLKIIDIQRLAKAAHAVGAIVVVDNTFATPLNQHPLALGADLVIHSATKYLGGHADALGGIVCGRKKLVETINHFREIAGSSLHPEAAYLLVRSLKTLHLRIARQNASAMEIATFLEGHPAVDEVFYPGLASHNGHDIARRQMVGGFGGMVSFTLQGGMQAVKRFLPALEYVHLAANLGSVETIAGTPSTTSHLECTDEEQAAMGIPEGLIRYSVGVEDVADLIGDLSQALERVA